MHNSLNAEAEMITSIMVPGGNGHDGKQFPDLVEKDGALLLPVRIYSADRGCDDGENHYLLKTLGLESAIHLNRYRTEKKDGNKENRQTHSPVACSQRDASLRRLRWTTGISLGPVNLTPLFFL